jgi:hypothetical protein
MSNGDVRALYGHNRQGQRIKLKLGGKAVRKRPTRQAPFATIRCRELERIFRDRYGPVLPDDDAGRGDAEIMLQHIARKQAGDRQWLMEDYLDQSAPWLKGKERAALIRRVFRKPLSYRADTLAAMIGLTFARRRRLGITTIGAIDMSLEQREKLNREHDRDYQRDKRRATGVQPREEYEQQSISQSAPWKAEGISRASWYRRQGAANDAPPSSAQKPIMHSTDLSHARSAANAAAHYAADRPMPRATWPSVTGVTSASSA